MSLATIVADIFKTFANRPAIGARLKVAPQSDVAKPERRLLPNYRTTSYSDLWIRTGHVASSLYHHQVAPIHPGDSVAILSFTNVDYVALDIACIRIGAVTVPLQTNTQRNELIDILNETSPVVLACSIEQLDNAIACIVGCSSIKRLIVLNVSPEISTETLQLEQAEAELRERGLEIIISTLHQAVESGVSLPDVALDTRPSGENELSMLIYTSGSTGTPKGAMYTQKLAAGMWGGSWATIFSEARAVTFHYMPMSHVAGHSSLKSTLARGGTCYFTAHDNLATLIEDISQVKPTELSLVPRVCEMFYQKYQRELARHQAIDGDLRSLNILNEMRTKDMGGCVTWASCSSAPIGAKLKAFIERLLAVPLHNVYGSTEAGAIWIDNQLLRPPVEDYKLCDVPELGYYLTDRPYPRGELLLKTSSVIPGYYKRPELTKELFNAAGYYRTGDIIAEHGKNKLYFVDRRKNVLKLSQGEFVALARIETLLAANPDIDSIFMHADSHWSFPLAVIAPNGRVKAHFDGNEDSMRKHLLESIRRAAKEARLRSYEIPRDFIFASESFTQQNGMLSDHGKPLWSRLRQRYEAQLTALHQQIKSKEAQQLLGVHSLVGQRPAIEVVLKAVQAVLGISERDIDAIHNFSELGGDSMSALTLSSLLSEAFGVAVPVDMVVSAAYDLQYIANYIEEKEFSNSVRPSAQKVHGKDASRFRASDLTLDKFLSTERITHHSLGCHDQERPQTILLTGATGYLGRFLCLDILRYVEQHGGKLICLIRGQDAEQAHNRLLSEFGGVDSQLRQRLVKLGEGLEVIAGDIGFEHLGLDAKTWERLSEEVTCIIHAGALVNHLLPYASLFDANVNATAELIRLALTLHRKPISFMSSIAVSTLSRENMECPLDESQDIRQWGSIISEDDTYAAGYGLTKWASEVLLREAHEHFGVPVTVYRSSMILANSKESGQLNLSDMFTRLLLSIATTGLAPSSFYQLDTHNAAKNAHYDGLPVDFTAAAIIKTSLQQQPEGYRSFNLVNHHDDGVSLDSIVDWMKEIGVKIHKITDYADWLVRFERAMRDLPETVKSQSMLPLVSSLAKPSAVRWGSSIPSDKFQAALTQGENHPFEVPKISMSLIERYVSDLQDLGLVTVNAEQPTIAPSSS